MPLLAARFERSRCRAIAVAFPHQSSLDKRATLQAGPVAEVERDQFPAESRAEGGTRYYPPDLASCLLERPGRPARKVVEAVS